MTKKSIAYSILDLALVSEGLTLKQTFNNTLKLAQHAENSGFTRYWLAEHHNAANIEYAMDFFVISKHNY